MAGTFHIVASCADRKLQAIPERLRLRAHQGDDLQSLYRSWRGAVRDEPVAAVAAKDLYGGPYWTAVKSIGAGLGRPVQLWVASAGYGLVPSDAALKPYSVTFASGQHDSVLRGPVTDPAQSRRTWWKLISSERGPAPGSPRSLRSLVEADPTARLLVLGSPAYLQALEHDLLDAQRASHSAEILLISGAPGPASRALQDVWLSSTAELLVHVGGALPSLHARVAAHVIAELVRSGASFADARHRWTALAQGSSRLMPSTRTPASDDEVKQFIRSALKADPKAKHSRLLREYRESGRACEQSRFRELFRQAAGDSAP